MPQIQGPVGTRRSVLTLEHETVGQLVEWQSQAIRLGIKDLTRSDLINMAVARFSGRPVVDLIGQADPARATQSRAQ